MRRLWKMARPAAAAAAVVLACLSTVRAAAVGAEAGVDPAIQGYEKTSGVDGNLNSVGSDTLNNLMTYWAEAFGKLYPNVKIQVEGKGSATAPPALAEGAAKLRTGRTTTSASPKPVQAHVTSLAQSRHNTSACSSTSSVARACLSGG